MSHFKNLPDALIDWQGGLDEAMHYFEDYVYVPLSVILAPPRAAAAAGGGGGGIVLVGLLVLLVIFNT